ncbi:MAG: ribbon-helix-helix protein, CopG family [Candidatus Riflebacteria bacterium]|nr:ribbon-helix-helix protein, CopG family [Candidatus Riflebacteria bacterium]
MSANMVRTQIQLPPAQARALKSLAASRGISMAEMIRLAIDEMLRTKGQKPREELWDRALEVAGRYRSGRHDLSEKHDEHLAEVFDE